MKPANLLVIMSDEHSRKVSGCYGHPMVQTPHLDALAARGTRFTDAYTTSPICVPARAAFAAGKYVHQIGFWDNADPYDGSVASWHHLLRDQGHEVVSIGKLHFRAAGEDHGFSEEIVPMHVVDGVGDVLGLLRNRVVERGAAKKMAATAGPGESSYTTYDRDIAARAQVWLREQAPRHRDRPWVLFVSFVAPHFPLIAPPEFYYRYPADKVPLPKLYGQTERPAHPFLADYAGTLAYDRYFDDEKVRKAIAAYFGLCSFLDDNIGQVISALKDSGLADSTRVVYTSDHGDNLGTRGLWGKSTMYEEAVGVPLIVAGPGVPSGAVRTTPVSHVDLFPFFLQAAGAPLPSEPNAYPGRDPLTLDDDDAGRAVLAEYHATGSTEAAFMLRLGRFKYVYYPSYPAQLFDLATDPEEIQDLAGDPRFTDTLRQCHRRLVTLCDPDQVDRQAKARQAELIAQLGGPDAILARGDFGFSPPPGVEAKFL